VKLWQTSGVTGNVLLERRGELFVWDGLTRRLQIIEANRGGLKSTIELPQVDFLLVGGPTGAELFAGSKDGRVQHLSPLN
jgi:hypothetical protein